jgi:hypothetical protein
LFQCGACRHQTSLTAGTLMEHTKLPLTTWFLAIHLISQAKTRPVKEKVIRDRHVEARF